MLWAAPPDAKHRLKIAESLARLLAKRRTDRLRRLGIHAWLTGHEEQIADPHTWRVGTDRLWHTGTTDHTVLRIHDDLLDSECPDRNGPDCAPAAPEKQELCLWVRSCTLAHGSVLMSEFLEPEALRALVDDFRAAGLEPVDLAVMELADKVAHDATSVTQADVDRLRALGLTDTEILDVVLAAAARCFFSKTLDALGAEPDAKYSELEPGLRQTLTIGRPIADG